VFVTLAVVLIEYTNFPHKLLKMKSKIILLEILIYFQSRVG